MKQLGGEMIKLFTLTMLLLLMPSLAVSEEVAVHDGLHESELALLRTVLHNERKAVIKGNIMLSEDEAKNFWSVYHAYRMHMNDVNDHMDALIVKYSELPREAATTDKDALALLDEFQALQKKRLDIKRQYIKRFQKVIPAKKVARFYQIDFRLDNIEQLGLAQKIPLLQ